MHRTDTRKFICVECVKETWQIIKGLIKKTKILMAIQKTKKKTECLFNIRECTARMSVIVNKFNINHTHCMALN